MTYIRFLRAEVSGESPPGNPSPIHKCQRSNTDERRRNVALCLHFPTCPFVCAELKIVEEIYYV
jgi:hypothetical protein